MGFGLAEMLMMLAWARRGAGPADAHDARVVGGSTGQRG